MTVTYIHRVPSAAKIGAFFRLLAIWKGSVMKGIWKDLAVFCVLYSGISLSYRYWMVDDESVKSSFEKICVYMNKFSEFIPLSFLLGSVMHSYLSGSVQRKIVCPLTLWHRYIVPIMLYFNEGHCSH